jgi:hypothetical protein
MEDILASIRRVLTKIKGPADIGNKPPEGQLHRNDADNGVPVLDPSMMASGSGKKEHSGYGCGSRPPSGINSRAWSTRSTFSVSSPQQVRPLGPQLD